DPVCGLSDASRTELRRQDGRNVRRRRLHQTTGSLWGPRARSGTGGIGVRVELQTIQQVHVSRGRWRRSPLGISYGKMAPVERRRVVNSSAQAIHTPAAEPS